MKKVFSILTIIFFISSCNNDKDDINTKSACGVDNPIENLAWLKDMIQEKGQNYSDLYKYMYIKQSTYNNEAVFIDANCCPECNSVFPVYNCSGEEIGVIGDEKFPSDLFSKGKVIWKSKDNECDL